MEVRPCGAFHQALHCPHVEELQCEAVIGCDGICFVWSIRLSFPNLGLLVLFTEDSRAPWNPCHDRVKDPGDPCCYQYPLGKWQAAYGNGCSMPQWTGEMGTRPPCPLPVPGRTRAPQTQVDRAKKIVENVLAQSLKDASNEALLS